MNLAHTSTLTYNKVVSISLVYNYIIHNVGLRLNDKKRNKRTLKKVL